MCYHDTFLGTPHVSPVPLAALAMAGTHLGSLPADGTLFRQAVATLLLPILLTAGAIGISAHTGIVAYRANPAAVWSATPDPAGTVRRLRLSQPLETDTPGAAPARRYYAALN